MRVSFLCLISRASNSCVGFTGYLVMDRFSIYSHLTVGGDSRSLEARTPSQQNSDLSLYWPLIDVWLQHAVNLIKGGLFWRDSLLLVDIFTHKSGTSNYHLLSLVILCELCLYSLSTGSLPIWPLKFPSILLMSLGTYFESSLQCLVEYTLFRFSQSLRINQDDVVFVLGLSES